MKILKHNACGMCTKYFNVQMLILKKLSVTVTMLGLNNEGEVWHFTSLVCFLSCFTILVLLAKKCEAEEFCESCEYKRKVSVY